MNLLTAASVFYAAAYVLIYCAATVRGIKIKKTPLYVMTFFFLIALSVIAYHTKPYEDDDLVFYFELMEDMRRNGLKWTLTESIYASDLVINLFFFAVAKTGVFRLLPAISVFLIYTLFFSMLFQYQAKYEASQYSLLFFFMVHFGFLFFRWTLSGIRNYLAFAIFAYALMRELALKKRGPLNWVLYLVAIFTHFSLAYFLLIRILCSRFFYGYLERFKYLLVGWGLVSGLGARLLMHVPIGIVQKMGSKVNDYFLYADFDVRKTLLRFALFAVVFFMFLAMKRSHPQAMREHKRYYAYLEFTLLMMLGSIFIPLLFDRSVSFLAFLAYPLFADFFQCTKKSSKYLFFTLLLLVSLVMYAIQAVDAVHYWRFFA